MSSSRTEPQASRWRLRWPQRLGSQLALLLAASLGLSQLCSLLALRALSLEPSNAQMAQLMVQHVVALRALQAAAPAVAASAGAPRLQVETATAPPAAAQRPWLPFARQLVDGVEARLADGSQVLLEDAGVDRLWISPARPGQPWLALPVPDFKQQAAALLAVSLLLAALLVVLAAALFGRHLARPLRQLAEAAPALVRGEPPRLPLAASAPLEVRAIGAALTQAAAQVRASAEQRELMLAGLSHDLRTPLARMRLAVELLEGSDAGLLEQLRSDLGELDQIVGEFIDLVRHSRSEPWQTLALDEVLRAAAAQVSAAGWLPEVASELSVSARPRALRRILINLLQNAERHGAPPYALRAGRNDGEAWVEVIDHGPGIAADAWHRLLQPFQRGQTRQPGSGLGLAIAAQLASALAGRIDAERRGGEFVVRLSWPAAGAAA